MTGSRCECIYQHSCCCICWQVSHLPFIIILSLLSSFFSFFLFSLLYKQPLLLPFLFTNPLSEMFVRNKKGRKCTSLFLLSSWIDGHSYTKGKNETEKLLLEQRGEKRKNGRKYILLNEDDYFPLSFFSFLILFLLSFLFFLLHTP